MNVCYKSGRVLLSQWRHTVLALPSVRTVRHSENFTFDWDKVPDTYEKERKQFEEFCEEVGEARINNNLKIENVEYTASQNAEEWKHVQHLVDLASPTFIPVPEKSDEVKPSGFYYPSAKPGDYPYYVRRAPSWLFPVYVGDYAKQNKKDKRKFVVTTIRRVDGDIFALRKDLDAFLFERYEREFICKVMEIAQKLIYRGNVEKDIKDFLRLKGF
eukprot:TRINITY_DN1471_c0_g1_i2.p1 TRINITY_DN1471_c0_g1~~TRINITY_DN1471_c0_g1_i2.p1  ORF type:complete len:215 (-),score=29.59 TRINITY_DN1471_c0_g1_i2:28-672(-)